MAAGAKKKKSDKSADDPNHKLISQNRRAKRNYELFERYEAGLVLTGTEVKSCRRGKAHVNDAYVTFRGDEAFLINSHIAEYEQGGHFNHAPARERKLLMHRRELDKLATKVRERGFVGVPLRLYFKRGRVKVEIAVGRGRTHEDKRQRVKDREAQLEVQRALRRGKR